LESLVTRGYAQLVQKWLIPGGRTQESEEIHDGAKESSKKEDDKKEDDKKDST
tara:strand:+ start:431 stop:589 length:159 start_codon:yes stop_codon:yes gene_type:complete